MRSLTSAKQGSLEDIPPEKPQNTVNSSGDKKKEDSNMDKGVKSQVPCLYLIREAVLVCFIQGTTLA